MKNMTGKLGNETGSTLIEFTLVLSLLLALTFAMIDFGRYVYANNVIESSAQEGARAGLVSAGNIETAVLGKLLTLDQDKATVSFQACGSEIKSMIHVDVTYQFSFITPYIGAAAGGPIQLQGSAGMLCYPNR